MNKVVWRAIKGYEGIYEISNEGEVKSLSRKRKNGKASYISEEKILKKTKSTTGYFKVDLKNDNKRRSFKIHRLVALAFIPNPMNKPNVNHIDGRVLNNEVNNLNWCTQKENMLHCKALGLRRRKLDANQEIELIKLYLSKKSIIDICERFKISSDALYKTLKRHNIKTYSMSERRIKFMIDENELQEQLKTKSQKQIAEKIGCDASLISHYAKRIKTNGGIYKC